MVIPFVVLRWRLAAEFAPPSFKSRRWIDALLNIGTAGFALFGIILQMARALIHRESGKAVATQLSEQNPFNFSRFEGWFAGIEKRALKLGDVFGSPLFDRASAELGNGRRLVIETSNNGPHKPLYSVGDLEWQTLYEELVQSRTDRRWRNVSDRNGRAPERALCGGCARKAAIIRPQLASLE